MNDHDVRSELNHWVLVADASRARLFAAPVLLDELRQVDAMVHPGSRMPARDIMSDDRGATREGSTGMQSRFEPHTDPHQVEVDAFARELAARLADGLAGGRFERLVLIAPPAFLGALRAQLDRECERAVVRSIDREWTTLSEAELVERIRGVMADQPIVPEP